MSLSTTVIFFLNKRKYTSTSNNTIQWDCGIPVSTCSHSWTQTWSHSRGFLLGSFLFLSWNCPPCHELQMHAKIENREARLPHYAWHCRPGSHAQWGILVIGLQYQYHLLVLVLYAHRVDICDGSRQVVGASKVLQHSPDEGLSVEGVELVVEVIHFCWEVQDYQLTLEQQEQEQLLVTPHDPTHTPPPSPHTQATTPGGWLEDQEVVYPHPPLA